jgi:hypothetical protein
MAIDRLEFEIERQSAAEHFAPAADGFLAA